ncbi:MAG: hypothetical protein ABIB55_00415 [Candidatus Nealsonbacteria bacterium]
MSWLIVAISAYLILAVVYLVDKWLLVGPIPSHKTYIFYIGALQIFALFLIPFTGLVIPGPFQIFLSLASGAFFVYGLYWFFKGLQFFEPSRIVPAIGGLLPIFSFLLIFIFSGWKETLIFKDFIAFLLLISGSILLTCEKSKRFSLESMKISVIAAILIAFSFVSAKYVYLEQSFWSGFIWIKMGSFLAGISILLLFWKEILAEIFKKKEVVPRKKTTVVFFLNQGAGAGANILQNWAIALAPLAYIAFINALQGVQYVFLLAFAALLSLKFPQILKEEVSKGVIFQKIIAILLIGGGLWILAVK